MCFATALAVDVKGRGFFFSIRHPTPSSLSCLTNWVFQIHGRYLLLKFLLCLTRYDTKKATSVQDCLVLTYTVRKLPSCCLFLKLKFCKCGLEKSKDNLHVHPDPL